MLNAGRALHAAGMQNKASVVGCQALLRVMAPTLISHPLSPVWQGSVGSGTCMASSVPLSRCTPSEDRNLVSVFKMFDVIRAVATRHDGTARIAREAVEDFRADGCVLLELRTTPKVGGGRWSGFRLQIILTNLCSCCLC
jgi:hypothetical protein